MLNRHFGDLLAAAVSRAGNPVVVGIDPCWEQLPSVLRSRGGDDWQNRAVIVALFAKGILDVVAPLVPAVKVQAAFFEELGPAGMSVMLEVISHAQDAGLLVIVDGKRNDIGNTAAAYARAYLGREGSAWRADALTVSPYLGDDSLSPFVEVARERGAGVFVLVKTSNPGGKMLQDVVVVESLRDSLASRRDASTMMPLYRRVAQHVEELAAETAGDCGYGIVGAVVGATYPQQLAELRAAMPHAWLLVPGYGSQGGTAADVAAAFDSRGLGAIINNSRGLIFAHERPEYAGRFGAARWQEAVEAATRDMIGQLRAVMKG